MEAGYSQEEEAALEQLEKAVWAEWERCLLLDLVFLVRVIMSTSIRIVATEKIKETLFKIMINLVIILLETLKTTDQELSKTGIDCSKAPHKGGDINLQCKRAFFLGHPVVIYN